MAILVGLQERSGEGSDPVCPYELGRSLVTDSVCLDKQIPLPPSPFLQSVALATTKWGQQIKIKAFTGSAVFTVEQALPSHGIFPANSIWHVTPANA